MPQLQNIPMFIFQQDGNPAHFHCEVRQYLNTVLPGRWIGCVSGNDQPLMLWTPRSHDIMPCDFFFSLGICRRPGIHPTIAMWPRWPKGTDCCSSEEYRCTHVDACVTRTWILCHPWCTHRTSLIAKKKISLPMAVNNSSKVGPLVFLF